jgi:hypothetical protein
LPCVSLYYVATATRVHEASNLDVATEHLDVPSDRAVVPAWIPCPPDSSTRYFARVELYHKGDGVLLAVADSAPFRTGCGL